MDSEEAKKNLLFHSFIKVDNCLCSCEVCEINRLHGYFPDSLCGKNLGEWLDSDKKEDFECEVQGICPCNNAHTGKLVVKDGLVELNLSVRESKRPQKHRGL